MAALGFLGATQLKVSRDLINSKRIYMYAESGLEDVLLRLKLQKPVDPTELLTFSGSGIANGTVSTAYQLTGVEYTVESNAQVMGGRRNVMARVGLGWDLGLPFSGAVEAGFLGANLEGSSVIQGAGGALGNVVAGSSIDGSGGVADQITGDIKVARPIANDPIYSQRNPSNISYPSPPPYAPPWDPTDPAYQRKARDLSTHRGLAQSFIPSTTAYGVRARLYMKRNYSSGAADVDVYVVNNNATINTPGGQPYALSSGQTIANVNRDGSAIPTAFDWVTFEFTANRPLIENQKYWLVVVFSQDSPTVNFSFAVAPNDTDYTLGQNTCYGAQAWCNSVPDGDGTFGPATAKYSSNPGAANPSWTTSELGVDLVFQVDMGEGTKFGSEYTNQVKGTDVGGTITASTVDNANTTSETGTIRYRNIVPTVLAAYGTPSQVQCVDGGNGGLCIDMAAVEPGPMPKHQFSNFGGGAWQESVQYWKDQANAGVLHSAGDYIVGAGGTTPALGSGRIAGKLALNNNSTLVLQGGAYLWVQGGIRSTLQGSAGQPCKIRVNDLDGNGKRMPAYILFSNKVNVKNCVLSAALTDPSNPGLIHVVSFYENRLDGSEPQNTIDIEGSSQDGTYFAPLGEISMNNNADVVAVRSAKIRLRSNTIVTYEQGSGVPSPGTGGDITLEFFEFHEIE